jgi:S1-C subfamily serine protease
MVLKKHHKIIIGGFSSFLIILLILNSTLIYILYGQLQLSYNKIEVDIKELKEDTQSKLNEITENLLRTKTNINFIKKELGSIDEEFNLLKASTSTDFSGIIEDSIKSIVTIRTEVGQGTGFIITDQGYIVTNLHILSGGKTIKAINYEQDTFQTELIGYDQNFDIALLKIKGEYKKLKFADSDKILIGEKVIATGNPLGLQFSVTEGIVSAINRKGINNIEAYVQTDAALNPGNSGGPLINKAGEVIGINNFKIGLGENLGFALESNYIVESINKIAIQNLNQTLI